MVGDALAETGGVDRRWCITGGGGLPEKEQNREFRGGRRYPAGMGGAGLRSGRGRSRWVSDVKAASGWRRRQSPAAGSATGGRRGNRRRRTAVVRHRTRASGGGLWAGNKKPAE